MARDRLVDVSEVLDNQQTNGFAISVFLLCCLVMLADGFDNQAINYAAPAIIREWGIDRASMTLVFNVSIAGWIVGSIAFATFADRIGRRPTIILAVFTFGLFTLAIPFATDLVCLSLLRFCASVGIGGGMPMAIALVSDFAKSKSRALCATLLFLGYTAGSSGGGLLAAEIIPNYGWRAVFYGGGIAALAIAAVLVVSLPESLRYLVLKRSADPRILDYAFRLNPTAGFDAKTSFTIGEAARHGVPMADLFTDGRAAMTVFLWFGLGLAFVTHFFLSQWLTTLLTPELGFANAARTQAVFQAGAAFASVFGFLTDRKGVPAITIALMLSALPVAAIGVAAGLGPISTMTMALASGILLLGGDVALSAVPSMIYPTAIRATATGAAFGVGRVGAILGPMIAGVLIYLETPVTMIFILGALPVLAASVACFMLDKSIIPTPASNHGAKPSVPRTSRSWR